MAMVLQVHWLCSLYSKANGISNTPPNFRSRVELENSLLEAIQPLDEIKGMVIITAEEPVTFLGIRVQLNATISLKVDPNGEKPEFIKEGLIQGPTSSKSNTGEYIYSPIRTDLIKDTNETKSIVPVAWAKSSRKRNNITIEAGTHSYPFTLIMPVEPLPTPFKNQYGRLEYKIAAYMEKKSETPIRSRDNPRFVQIAASFLKFTGYKNLSHYPSTLLEPKIVKKYSQDTAITAVLTVQKICFLPEETINYELNLSNPYGHVVTRISARLVRRIDYNAGRTNKQRTFEDVVDTSESYDVGVGSEDYIFHVGNLIIPKDCIPSYNVKPIYGVTYFIQYEVAVAELSALVKGNTEVIIGTTKDDQCEVDETIVINRRMTALTMAGGSDNRTDMMIRSDSMVSDNSVVNALPPAYSQLSSRAPSILSLETLPPHYDDLE